MRVLSINCGSSTLKFDVLDVSPTAELTISRVTRGTIDRIGGAAAASLSVGDERFEDATLRRDHTEAFSAALDLLKDAGLLSGVQAVGHRVVHGGTRFREPAPIDDAVIEAIEVVSELAPLHNRPAVAVIKAAQAYFAERLPMVATFDTSFYVSLPDIAALYALPKEVRDGFDIKRFGFHGLAHGCMVERYRALRPEIANPRLITLQLGNGCSATASISGRPVDTSMGFTPLEGLIMGTRCGDLDPSIPLFLVERGDLSPAEVESLLNEQSGLLALSGKSNDMRDILESAGAGDADADLAVRAFCYRAKKYVGAYLATLGGANAIIFGGGIGENMPDVRERICAGLEWAGLELDFERNRRASQSDGRISAHSSRMEAWVVHVDEALMIARDVFDCVRVRNSKTL